MKINDSLKYFLIFFGLFQLTAQECFYDTTYSGEGTFYDGVAGSSSGNCSLPVAQGDFLHCALNNINYDGSNACGACITVTGPKGSVTLQVVDRCPECASGDVDMTEEAFSQIADVIDGRVPITWQYTTCESNITNDIKVVFKEGSSEFWTAIQFRNTTHAVATMEYLTDNNSWVSVDRELFNFFIATEGISSPMNLRVTSVLGEQVVFENISLNLSEEIGTNKQFTTPEECLDGILDNEDFSASSYTYSIITPDNTTIATISSKNELTNIDKISLYNLSGQKINAEISVENQNSIRMIDTENLVAGVYIITIEDNKKNSITKKIVIQ